MSKAVVWRLGMWVVGVAGAGRARSERMRCYLVLEGCRDESRACAARRLASRSCCARAAADLSEAGGLRGSRRP